MRRALFRAAAALALASGPVTTAAQDGGGDAGAAPFVCIPASAPSDMLSAVVFVGESAYLEDETLAAIEERFLGCSVTALDPARVAEAVNAAYAAHPAPLAFARPVSIGRGSVTVELVEIAYARVAVRENETTNAAYVIARSGARTGDPADVARLQQRLAAIPETDDIRVEADLEPGEEVGTSDLILTVQEPPPVAFLAEADNWGVPETGREQFSITGAFRSLTGRRDNLTVVASGSEGAYSALGLYSLPVSDRGTRVRLSSALDWSERIDGEPLLLGLKSTTLTLGATVSHPVRAGDFGNDVLTAGFSAFRDGSKISGFDLLDQVTTEYSVGSAHVRRRAGRYSVVGTQQLVYGETQDRIVGDTFDYVRWTGTVDGALRLVGSLTASVTGGWQVSSDVTSSAVRFATTGPTLVRGYPATSGGGDVGFYFRNQLSVTRAVSAAPLPVDLRLTPYVFTDVGEAFDYVAGDLVSGGLAHSVGAGLDFAILPPAIGDRRIALSGTAFVAMPLRDTLTFRADDPFAALQLSVSF